MRTLPNHGVDAHILTKPLHSLRTAVRGVSGGQQAKLQRECPGTWRQHDQFASRRHGHARPIDRLVAEPVWQRGEERRSSSARREGGFRTMSF